MFIPELRESEDERMMRVIGLALTDVPEERFTSLGTTLKDCFSYLEKQKEKKPEIKYVYTKFRKGDVIEPITPNGHFTPVRVVNIWDGSYSCRSDDDKAYLSLPIRNEDEYRLAEQKPAEWSEEDENKLYQVMETLLADKTVALRDNPHCKALHEAYDAMIAWLKSLRPSWKPSELEKGALRTAIYLMTEERNFPKAAEQLQNILNAFEGKESRHDWKPSQEQVEALKSFLDYHRPIRNGSVQNWQEFDNLESLYEQLKKL